MELLRKWLGHPEDIYNLLRFKMGGYRAVMPRMDTVSGEGCAGGGMRFAVAVSLPIAGGLELEDLQGPFQHTLPFHDYVTGHAAGFHTSLTAQCLSSCAKCALWSQSWRGLGRTEHHKPPMGLFPWLISMEFRNLSKVYQDVISDICHKMGVGMAEFLEKKVDSQREWDKYCHYVAGLVGIGLSRLFSASELEDSIVGQDTDLANSMGLFLQKTNIIRDYLEDQLEGREFWPREVWSRYAKKLSDLAKPENIDVAVQCLNELITNALHHVPDVLTYLSRLKNQSVFNFCAIPQVMAIATLAACYNNQQVFKGVVKIRKGQAVTLMMDATNIQAVKAIMYQYVEEV
ncbi:FDFT synthase, partial [Horornis vulcanius]|nr:FDFT synthase [Horornis vulcanius]